MLRRAAPMWLCNRQWSQDLVWLIHIIRQPDGCMGRTNDRAHSC